LVSSASGAQRPASGRTLPSSWLRRSVTERRFASATTPADLRRVASNTADLDLPADPALDGTGLGLKLGVGGGVRVYGGESFVVRGDIAWSPDARPIGGYLAPGEIF
jgi:hypothetical protein